MKIAYQNLGKYFSTKTNLQSKLYKINDTIFHYHFYSFCLVKRVCRKVIKIKAAPAFWLYTDSAVRR